MPQHHPSLLRHLQALNTWNPQHFLPLYIADQRVGYCKPYMCEALRQWPEYFVFKADGIGLTEKAHSFHERSRMLDEVVHKLVEQGVIDKYLGESYPVTGRNRSEVFAIMDRGAAGYFGIRTYGQHLNGYVRSESAIKLWIARRSADRIQFPNRLDNIVAGGLPYNLSLQQNLIKECGEEADIPRDLVNSAIATGAVSYCCETEIGLKPDTLYCYDVELPASFIPQNTDGEVAEFQLMDLPEVIDLVLHSDEFKTNCNLVLLDFFVRHGAIDPEHPQYLDLLAGLHTSC
jgi:hypothetical protein